MAVEIDGATLCDCGHTAHWHGAPDGVGTCEHDGNCLCSGFVGADLLEQALETYSVEYARSWRPGGDAGDHEDAHRGAVSAVLALAQARHA